MSKPENTIRGLTFFPVPEVRDVDVAFGMDASQYFDRNNLNSLNIPSIYKETATTLFFDGGKLPELREDVDTEKAYRFMNAMFRSFDPPMESKIATVAYALWNWIEGES